MSCETGHDEGRLKNPGTGMPDEQDYDFHPTGEARLVVLQTHYRIALNTCTERFSALVSALHTAFLESDR